MGFSLGGMLSGGLTGFLAGGPVGALVGAGIGGFAGGKAEEAQQNALNAQVAGQREAIAEQRRQFDLTRGDLQPFLQGGLQAQGQIQNILSGGYQADPLLQSQLGQAEKFAGRKASVLGGGGGAYQKDVVKGMSDVLNQRINQLLALRSGGQAAGTSIGAFGSSASTGIGENLSNIGQAQAGYNIGKANSINNLLNQGAYALPYLFQSRNQLTPQTTFSPGGAGAYGGF